MRRKEKKIKYLGHFDSFVIMKYHIVVWQCMDSKCETQYKGLVDICI